ncbi:MAG: AAA family ATPase [Candidatus Heimdallarchaeaceae archaeon]
MPLKLDIRNIGGFSDGNLISLKIEKGINVIEGPNASGKTSVLLGIRAALLPQSSLDSPYHRGIINRKAKNAEVIFSGDINFTRKFEVYNDHIKALSNPLSSKGNRVNNLSILLGDNEILRYIDESKSFKDLFEEYSGSQYYTRLIEWLENQLYETNQTLNTRTKELIIYNRLKTEINSFENELRKLNYEYSQLPQIIVDEEEDRELKTKIKEIRDEIANLNREKNETQNLIQKLKRNIQLYEKEIMDKRALIQRFEEKHPDPDNEIQKLAEKMNKHHLLFEENKRKLELINLELRQKKSVLANWNSKKGESGECPICNNPLSKSTLRNLIEQLEKRYYQLQEIGQTEYRLRSETVIKKDELELEFQKYRNFKEKLDKEERHLENDFYRDYSNLTLEKIVVPYKEKIIEPTKSSVKTSKGYEYRALPIIINELENKEKELKEETEKLNEDDRKKYEELKKKENEIKEVETKLNLKKEQLEELGDIKDVIQQLEKTKVFLLNSIRKTSSKADEVRNEIRRTFEAKIMEVYNGLGFKDFDKIYLNSNFNLIIERKKMGAQPVSELSGAERSTIGVILILAAKELYDKEFPIFVMDEVILNYDPDKMKRILEYVKEKVNYVIVTSLSKETQDMIRVKYGLDSL